MPDWYYDLSDTVSGWIHGVSVWVIIGVMVAAYLLLTARSAHKQGEFGEFARSLGLAVALLAVLGGFIEAWIWVDRHW
ncbi:hypothetical protein [Nitrospirillum sp. BR 11163]|uniref:hypothetical protein n=1 Tax=Nitrospirillum sp. BR 11163 TaxID=3104323 RepID=UPI002AFEDABA|nr:hypothetical protein [Nitrospirillum sp. BR 11163]MEA1674321.1 hypothetical protein [Nitrospirillum sp. BR 11163]